MTRQPVQRLKVPHCAAMADTMPTAARRMPSCRCRAAAVPRAVRDQCSAQTAPTVCGSTGVRESIGDTSMADGKLERKGDDRPSPTLPAHADRLPGHPRSTACWPLAADGQQGQARRSSAGPALSPRRTPLSRLPGHDQLAYHRGARRRRAPRLPSACSAATSGSSTSSRRAYWSSIPWSRRGGAGEARGGLSTGSGAGVACGSPSPVAASSPSGATSPRCRRRQSRGPAWPTWASEPGAQAAAGDVE